MKALLVSSAIVLMSMSAASAQSTGSPANAQHGATAPSSSSAATTQPNSTSSTANNEPLRQQVRDNLSKAGFTDIKIMPTSFMVRAKDQSGNPVMMVINPDSFTEVTAVQNTKDANQNTSANQNASKDSASSAAKH